ncbi:MAG TPA: hypothetical protein VD999_04630 [Vitreimonas sp.]|nr:hypothetical protein [Vitreimonas sp.]
MAREIKFIDWPILVSISEQNHIEETMLLRVFTAVWDCLPASDKVIFSSPPTHSHVDSFFLLKREVSPTNPDDNPDFFLETSLLIAFMRECLPVYETTGGVRATAVRLVDILSEFNNNISKSSHLANV